MLVRSADTEDEPEQRELERANKKAKDEDDGPGRFKRFSPRAKPLQAPDLLKTATGMYV